MSRVPPASESSLVTVNQGMFVRERQEPGVLISERVYQHYIQRLAGCEPSGWADLWLALAGVGGGLAVAALVTYLTLPSSASAGEHDIMLMLVILGAVGLVLSVIGYFTQRQERGKDIRDLKADLELHHHAD